MVVLFLCVLCVSARNVFGLLVERDRGFTGVLVIIPEVDGLAATNFRATLAAQGLGVHRQQELPIADADEFIVGCQFYFVHRKFQRQVASLHFNAQDAAGFFVDPNRSPIGGQHGLRWHADVPVGVLMIHIEVIHVGVAAAA